MSSGESVFGRMMPWKRSTAPSMIARSRYLSAFAAALAAQLTSGCGAPAVTAPGEPEWRPLLDGSTLSGWEKVREYDTAVLCEQGRHEEAVTWGKDEKRSPSVAEFRFRCERAERLGK